jgi:hypothetical protein
MKIVLNPIALPQDINDTLSNISSSQPGRSLRRAIQYAIALNKRAAIVVAQLAKGKSSGNSPRYENRCSRKTPVRKIAAIHVKDKLRKPGILLALESQAKACATGQVLSTAQA